VAQIKKAIHILFEMLKSNLLTVILFIIYIVVFADIIDRSIVILKILLWSLGYLLATFFNHLIVFRKIELKYDIFNEGLIWLTLIYLISGWAGYSICIYFTVVSLLLFFAERFANRYKDKVI